jgi:TatD DNase family protein
MAEITSKNWFDDLRAIAAALPVVETDSPYLAPGKYCGKRNEPAHMSEVAKTLAETCGVTPDAIAAQTTEDFFHLFNEVPQGSAGAA